MTIRKMLTILKWALDEGIKASEDDKMKIVKHLLDFSTAIEPIYDKYNSLDLSMIPKLFGNKIDPIVKGTIKCN